MPPAINDERCCALEKVEVLAQLGLADPEKARDALVAVLGVVEGVREVAKEAVKGMSVYGS